MNENQSLVFSGVFLAVCITLAIWRSRFLTLFIVAAIALFLSFALDAAKAIQLQNVITLVAFVPCFFFQKQLTVGRIVVLLALSLCLSISYFAVTEYPVYVRLEKLRARYPMISIADRLSYEKVKQNVMPTTRLSEHQVNQLEQAEDKQRYHLLIKDFQRVRYLRQLHDHTTYEFLGAPGFGMDRMSMFRANTRTRLREQPELLELPDAESIHVARSSDSRESEDLATSLDQSLHTYRLDLDWVDRLHHASHEDLFNPGRLGYIKERQIVAGFQSHRFTKIPDSPLAIIRLELVSLLKHSEPMVYVSENLPEMGSLDKVPIRQLNEFESQSLERLRLDSDLELKMLGKRVKMMGSLRASNDCLKCHTVQRGELLGALSYELVPRTLVKPTVSP